MLPSFFTAVSQEDQRVLAADIKRTRQAYAMFKREDVMQVVSQVLERWACGNGYGSGSGVGFGRGFSSSWDNSFRHS